MMAMPMTMNSWLLHATWLLPLAAALGLGLTPASALRRIRILSGSAALANLLIIAHLTRALFAQTAIPSGGTDGSSTVTQLFFVTRAPWLPELGGIRAEYFVGVDALSMFLMLLAAVIVVAGTWLSFRQEERAKEFFLLLQVLAAGTFGSFIAFDALLFFFFNELTLIPTFLLIALFGSGRPRFAAMKLTLMLMAGSAMVLMGILGMANHAGAQTFDLLKLSQVHWDPAFQSWAFPVLFTGFALLGNLFPLHIWSPEGHAAAPTAVSMFLAGVHMKIGGYGCLRLGLYLMPEGGREWAPCFAVLAAAGALWGALVALRQTDLKLWNAYASVSHCALVFLGLCAMNADGLRGAAYQMLAHGFISAALFAVIGSLYERTHTRDLTRMGGLVRSLPLLSFALALAGFAALGLPGLAGFAAELPIFLGGFRSEIPYLPWAAGVAMFSLVLASVYVLRAVNRILHGPQVRPPVAWTDAGWSERFAIGLLLSGVLALGLYPRPWAERLDAAMVPFLNQMHRR